MRECQAGGVPPAHYDEEMTAVHDYSALARELLELEEPLGHEGEGLSEGELLEEKLSGEESPEEELEEKSAEKESATEVRVRDGLPE